MNLTYYLYYDMFSIMSDFVTTNLRMPKEDWLDLKSMAGESGVSLNEFINDLIRFSAKARIMGASVREQFIKSKKKDPIWDLPNLHKKVKVKPMGLSAEDEVIYDI